MKRAKEWGDELENGTISVAEIYRVDVQNWTKFIRSMDSTQFNRDWYQKFFSAYGFTAAVHCKRFFRHIINAWRSSLTVCQPGDVQSVYLAARCNE
jgi:hypothetical protein